STIGVEHRSDRLGRDAALTRVDHDTASLDFLLCGGTQWNVAHVDAAAREPEAERATERRCVVILASAGDAEIRGLDLAAQFGDGRWRHRLAARRGERRND